MLRWPSSRHIGGDVPSRMCKAGKHQQLCQTHFAAPFDHFEIRTLEVATSLFSLIYVGLILKWHQEV